MTKNATPQVEAIYSIDTKSPMFERAIKAGITTSAIAPGSGNVIGGLVCAVKSYGKNIKEMCIKNPVALKAALGGNPKGVYGKRKELPMTRMGIASVLRDTLIKGQEYMAKKEKGEADFDLGLENVCKVLRRKSLKGALWTVWYAYCNCIAEEFDIEFTLDHAWGASDFYDDIAVAKNLKGVVYGPIGVLLLPGECGKIDIYSLIELDKRGVLCGIMTDGPICNPDLIIVQAGEVVRFGGNIERVINMLTINPARIIGVDDRVGSIEKGKDADLVIFEGMPALDTNARVIYTIIDGEIVYSAYN